MILGGIAVKAGAVACSHRATRSFQSCTVCLVPPPKKECKTRGSALVATGGRREKAGVSAIRFCGQLGAGSHPGH